MNAATTNIEVSKKNCVSCSHNLSKLKELCNRKGLTTSLNKKHKPCKKHKNDKVIIVYNSYKFGKLPTAFHKSLTRALSDAHKHIQRAKQLKKRRMIRELSHLDAFTVQDVIAKPSEAEPAKHKARGVGRIKRAPVSVADNDSDTTEIIFVKPDTPPPILERQCPFLPNEQDSLGLLNCTEDVLASQNLQKVKFWQQYGHPYIDELSESHYDICEADGEKNGLGWVSPAMSPIYTKL